MHSIILRNGRRLCCLNDILGWFNLVKISRKIFDKQARIKYIKF